MDLYPDYIYSYNSISGWLTTQFKHGPSAESGTRTGLRVRPIARDDVQQLWRQEDAQCSHIDLRNRPTVLKTEPHTCGVWLVTEMADHISEEERDCSVLHESVFRWPDLHVQDRLLPHKEAHGGGSLHLVLGGLSMEVRTLLPQETVQGEWVWLAQALVPLDSCGAERDRGGRRSTKRISAGLHMQVLPQEEPHCPICPAYGCF